MALIAAAILKVGEYESEGNEGGEGRRVKQIEGDV
jgi:hypothetical protein